MHIHTLSPSTDGPSLPRVAAIWLPLPVPPPPRPGSVQKLLNFPNSFALGTHPPTLPPRLRPPTKLSARYRSLVYAKSHLRHPMLSLPPSFPHQRPELPRIRTSSIGVCFTLRCFEFFLKKKKKLVLRLRPRSTRAIRHSLCNSQSLHHPFLRCLRLRMCLLPNVRRFHPRPQDLRPL